MIRSRALPEDFDMTKALHSPFGAISNVGSNRLPTINNHAPERSDVTAVRPLQLDLLQAPPVRFDFDELEKMLREWTRAYEPTKDT
jgi:hypothetical protein